MNIEDYLNNSDVIEVVRNAGLIESLNEVLRVIVSELEHKGYPPGVALFMTYRMLLSIGAEGMTSNFKQALQYIADISAADAGDEPIN